MWTWNMINLTNIYKTKTRWLMQTNTKSEKPKWDIPYIHFKMETLQSVLSPITPGCYLASLDLKDAYYSVPIHPDYTKFLKFIWKNQLYKFLVLPNCLCCGPRKFTKLTKPPIATIILDGHIIAIYIDDLINVGLIFDQCVENVIASIKLLK